jgi:hypothetical protein
MSDGPSGVLLFANAMRLIGHLPERYGCERERAEVEVDSFREAPARPRPARCRPWGGLRGAEAESSGEARHVSYSHLMSVGTHPTRAIQAQTAPGGLAPPGRPNLSR